MIKEYLTYINTGLIVILVLGAFGVFGHSSNGVLGASNCTGSITCFGDINLVSDSGYGTGTLKQNGNTILAASGALTPTTLAIGGGTSVSNYSCGTASYQIPSLSPISSGPTGGVSFTTTTVTVSGAVVGDTAVVSNNSSTNALLMYGVSEDAQISSAGVATVLFHNTSFTTSTAVTTSTLKVCFTH